ncbi:MAG: polysaccharide deacetylase family protein [Ruminiclostridium sp.]|nr:polysaccharide deacetylase family protein [Ruminiclostridium sp.]
MKIYVINPGHILKYLALLLLVALLISAVSITGMDVLGVFSPGKELPINYVETGEKIAAITFDCAWGADDIPQILDVLKSRNVKASFFIIGQWAQKYPDKVRMIAAEGHDVANHSYSHLRMGALDQARIAGEIKLCGEKLEELSGQKIELFRPPYGDYSNNVVSAARKLGYYTIQWNVDGIDIKVKRL